MSTSVSTAFVKQYEREVKLIYQREGSFLLPSIRNKPGVVGTTTTFQRMGTGSATTKSRNGVITPMNQGHNALTATMADFYAGDWHDKLDEAKIFHDERSAIARSGAYALGRKIDEQIIAVLNGTSSSQVTITLTNAKTIRAGMLTWVEALDAANVPDDGKRYAVITPRLWSQFMTVKEFAASDYVGVDGMKFAEGMPVAHRWKSFMGVLWKTHTGLPNFQAASATGYLYHWASIGYGINKFAGNVAGNESVAADIQWHNDRASWFIMHAMSGGCVLIDDTGVIEATWDDSAAIQVADPY